MYSRDYETAVHECAHFAIAKLFGLHDLKPISLGAELDLNGPLPLIALPVAGAKTLAWREVNGGLRHMTGVHACAGSTLHVLQTLEEKGELAARFDDGTLRYYFRHRSWYLRASIAVKVAGVVGTNVLLGTNLAVGGLDKELALKKARLLVPENPRAVIDTAIEVVRFALKQSPLLVSSIRRLADALVAQRKICGEDLLRVWDKIVTSEGNGVSPEDLRQEFLTLAEQASATGLKPCPIPPSAEFNPL